MGPQQALLATPGVSGGDITTGLIGWWKFDDNSGTTPVDSSSTGASSIFFGTNPTWVAPGRIGTSMLNFGGAGGVAISNQPSVFDTAAATYSALIRFSSIPNGYNAITSWINGNPDYRQMFVKSNGTLAMYFRGSGGQSAYDGTGANTLSTNTWYRITSTYSSAAGLIGYVGSSVDGTAAGNGTLAAIGNADYTIGLDLVTAGRYWNGDMDDVRVYNRALTALDVAALPT